MNRGHGVSLMMLLKKIRGRVEKTDVSILIHLISCPFSLVLGVGSNTWAKLLALVDKCQVLYSKCGSLYNNRLDFIYEE
jgi:hypothetical protein